ncbi:MAG TPA: FecR domain-containing protein [Candidatus Acidoferrales bacterium]|nr:FecR domain-containing protein [Candidatus Acidoferrales bacterium]
MRDAQQFGSPRPKLSRVEVYWHSVSYRMLVLYVLLFISVVLAVMYSVSPGVFTGALDRLDRMVGNPTDASAPLKPGQIRFVNLDGDVQVKKANSVRWQQADYRSTLDTGDLIQTGPEGAARLSFPDGTTYTVKGETLVTVEENSVARDRSTEVGMQVSTGAVDLATPAWDSPSSKAEISFADARASVLRNSRADVRSDASHTEGDITILAGAAEVKQGNQTVELGKWERAAVTKGAAISKSNVLAPPDLLAPLNFAPLIEPDPKQASVHFEWAQVPDATGYTLHVSSASTFNKLSAERHLTTNSTDVVGLEAGEYFWNVTAIDANKKESEPSDTYKFTLVAQGKTQEMLLEVDQTVLHGSVVEVIGRTEPGAALIINGQAVADIAADGKFRFFTDPLARGSQTISITGQNRRGGTATQRVQIVIP